MSLYASLTKKYLLKIVEMGNLFESNTNKPTIGILHKTNIYTLQTMIEDTQSRLKESNRIQFQLDDNLIIMKLIEYTKSILDENNTYRDAIDCLYNLRNLLDPILSIASENVENPSDTTLEDISNSDEMLKYAVTLIVNNIDYYSNISRIESILSNHITFDQLIQLSQDEIMSILEDTSTNTITEVEDFDDTSIYPNPYPTKTMAGCLPVYGIDTIEQNLIDKNNETNHLLDILRDTNTLDYIKYFRFPGDVGIVHATVYDVISSAFSHIPRGIYFKSISEFDSYFDQRDFVITVEKSVYNEAIRIFKESESLIRHTYELQLFVEYLSYLSQFGLEPKYFSNELIYRILFNTQGMCIGIRAQYYLDKLAIKTGFYDEYPKYNMMFKLGMDRRCSLTLGYNFEIVVDFIQDSHLRIPNSKYNDFRVIFMVEDTINNPFRFTQNTGLIEYNKDGFLLKKQSKTLGNRDLIMLNTISLLIDIHNSAMKLPKKNRKKMKKLLRSNNIWIYDYFQICQIIGKDNIIKSLDTLIRNFCACRNYANSIAYRYSETSNIIRDIYDINKYENGFLISVDSKKSIRDAILNTRYVTSLSKMMDNPTHSSIVGINNSIE